MAGRLRGKRALVTAAAQGIGKATAELFSAEGADVLATDINAARLNDVSNCRTCRLDVTKAPDINALVADIEGLDILFNCAGYVHDGSILDCSEQDWDYSFNVNVTSMYRLIRGILPVLIDGGGGSIINMSSVASSILGVSRRFVYGVSKAAVIGLTKSVACDFVTDGIRCNAICPGTVQSPSLDERLAASGNYGLAKEVFKKRQPMGRFGTADEVAHLALYLASDESAFTTGQIHIIDGGWSNV